MLKGLVIDEGILSKVGAKWRSHKYKLKKVFFKPEKTQLQIANVAPKNVVKEQWIRLVDYWCTPKSQKLSEIGKRSDKDDIHTTGSKSYAQKRNEFVRENERKPSILEFWQTTHLRKDGSYVENTNTQEFVDTAKKMVVESLANSSGKSKPLVDEEIFNKLIYDKDKPNQRVVGYGHGVSHGQVFGLKADLRKSILIDDRDTSRDVVKEELEGMKSTCANLVSQLSLVIAALSKRGIVIDHPTNSSSTGTIQSDDDMDNGT